MDRTFEQRLLEIITPTADARIEDVASETLPFADDSIDVVTCGVAHQFSDTYRFAIEARRVLKVGGVLAIYDAIVPEHKQAGDYVNSFYQLGDVNYGRAYSESDWRITLLDADFTVEHVETSSATVRLVEWAKSSSPYVLERLQILLKQAPSAVNDWLKPSCVGTTDATFEQIFIIITGKKNT